MAGIFRNYSVRGVSLVRDVLIETGTYRGFSLGLAAQHPYNEIHSIEFIKEYADDVAARFSNLAHVHVHNGSSPDILPKIIDPARATIFFLDAHYQASLDHEMDPAFGQCPVLEELRIIRETPWQVKPFILVDDAYEFDPARRSPKMKPGDWPDTADIEAAMPPGYVFFNDDDILYGLPEEVFASVSS